MRPVNLLRFATVAMSQSFNQSTNSSADVSRYTNPLCNGSISDANASAIVTHGEGRGLIGWDLNTARRAGAPDHSWAVTVTGGNGQELDRIFWYDTVGVNYADNVGIATDVCAFPNFDMPLNAHRLGQDDPGNCSTVLSQRCIDAVTSVAAESALKWTTYSSPPPYENLTAEALPSICTYIARDLQETIRKDCGPQMQADSRNTAGFSLSPKPLTGYNSSTLYSDNCTLSAGDKTLHPAYFMYPMNSERRAGSDIGYDNITNEITPILTVYFTVANVERKQCCDKPQSVLECVRPSNFSEGSRVPTALANGRPWPKAGLSAGAKGGIAAGVVVFVLAVGGVLSLWIAKRKKRTRATAAAARSDTKSSDDDIKLPPEADAGLGVHELTPKDRKQELDGAIVSELGGEKSKPSELANTSGPVELPADNTNR